MLAVTFSVAWEISLRLFARELGFNFPLCAGARLVTYSPNFDARKTEKILGCTSSSLQVLHFGHVTAIAASYVRMASCN